MEKTELGFYWATSGVSEKIMPRKNKILNIGDKAPLFTLTSVQRETVSLESYLSRQPVILAFFRGTW
ncbi:hypothetical protein C6502_22430 [Candidatus Poribacteria bacterium]|nr:MAG: hypothetical protein C6502_22430 [Candidatus Poribacteria bacterium]